MNFINKEDYKMDNFSLKLTLKLQLIMFVLWFFIGGNLLAYA